MDVQCSVRVEFTGAEAQPVSTVRPIRRAFAARQRLQRLVFGEAAPQARG